MPAARQTNHFFLIVDQKVKIVRKKNAKLKKSVHGTVFCENRQTGNVLLIVIFVIRTFFPGTRPEKSPFY